MIQVTLKNIQQGNGKGDHFVNYSRIFEVFLNWNVFQSQFTDTQMQEAHYTF